MKRFIFDLDGTLWKQDFEEENKFFKSVLSEEDYLKFVSIKGRLFAKYEKMHSRHNISELCTFLRKETGIPFTEEILNDWLEFNGNTEVTLYDGAIELLNYLKNKNKSLVVLSNRYTKEQKMKLKNLGILDYFDAVYGGDVALKPRIESYLIAKGDYIASECVMIGDSLEKDVLIPRCLGMDAVYYNPSIKEESKVDKTVKSLMKIKDLYD